MEGEGRRKRKDKGRGGRKENRENVEDRIGFFKEEEGRFILRRRRTRGRKIRKKEIKKKR